jgi:acetolactate synthase regulatory subunit
MYVQVRKRENLPKQILRVNPPNRGFTVKFCRFSAKNDGKYLDFGDFRVIGFLVVSPNCSTNLGFTPSCSSMDFQLNVVMNMPATLRPVLRLFQGPFCDLFRDLLLKSVLFRAPISQRCEYYQLLSVTINLLSIVIDTKNVTKEIPQSHITSHFYPLVHI